MILDGLLTFSGSSNAGNVSGITSGAQTDAPTSGTQTSTNVIDLGLSGLPNSASGGGARDIGVGDDPAMKLSAIVTTAFAGGTSLGLALQGAPDNGSGSAGSFTTIWTGPVVVEANLTQGAQLANVDMPRQIPDVGLARYLQVLYINAGTHTAGAIEVNLVLDEIRQPHAGTAGTFLGGYPAGTTVAN